MMRALLYFLAKFFTIFNLLIIRGDNCKIRQEILFVILAN
jgi:hypothetical protein